MVRVDFAVLVLPVKETEDGAKVQVAFCGRPVQVSCKVPE